MADLLWDKELIMSHEMELLKRINKLEVQLSKQAAASNFVFTHLISILNKTSGAPLISEHLKQSLSESLALLNHSERSQIKSAINEMLTPSVRNRFGPKPEDFLK